MTLQPGAPAKSPEPRHLERPSGILAGDARVKERRPSDGQQKVAASAVGVAARLGAAPLSLFSLLAGRWPALAGLSGFFGAVSPAIMGIQLGSVVFAACFGFGDAIISIPLLAMLLHVQAVTATPLVVGVSIFISLFMLSADIADGVITRSGRWKDSGLMIAGSIIGVPLGVKALVVIQPTYIRLSVGVLLVAYAAWCFWSESRKEAPASGGGDVDQGSATADASASKRPPHAPFTWSAVAGVLGVGLVAGVLGGAVGEFGPPIVVYGNYKRWDPMTMRCMLARYFFPMNIYAVYCFVAAGMWSKDMLAQVLASVPGVAVAVAFGTFANRRVSMESFSTIVYFSVLFLGALSIHSALFVAH